MPTSVRGAPLFRMRRAAKPPVHDLRELTYGVSLPRGARLQREIAKRKELRHETFNCDTRTAAAAGRSRLHDHGSRNRLDALRHGPGHVQLEELGFRLRNHNRKSTRLNSS